MDPAWSGHSVLVTSQARLGAGCAGALLSVGFALLTAAALPIGILGLLGWSWAGFDLEIALLLLGGAVMGAVGALGFNRTRTGDRPWSLLALWACLFASLVIALAIID